MKANHDQNIKDQFKDLVNELIQIHPNQEKLLNLTKTIGIQYTENHIELMDRVLKLAPMHLNMNSSEKGSNHV